MREEVRERRFAIHPVLYDVRAGCKGGHCSWLRMIEMLWVMLWGRDVRDLVLAFQERGGRFSFQLVPTVSKNGVNDRKSVAWVTFSALFCTHALKTKRRTWRIWMVLQTRGQTGKWVNRHSSTIMQQPPALLRVGGCIIGIIVTINYKLVGNPMLPAP